MPIQIAAILVNYHTTELLPEVIAQLSACEDVAEIIIVNNGGSPALKPGAFGKTLEQINLTENVGFAAAVNLGIARSDCPWVLLINPDVRAGPDCISQLSHWAVKLNAAIAAPRFYWDDARQFRLPPATGCSAGDKAATHIASQHALDAALHEQNWALRHDRYWTATSPFVEPFLSGACLLVRRNAFGPKLLDERYFVYYEDTDLSARALIAGTAPLCIPSAEAVHYWNQSPATSELKAGYMGAAQAAYIDQHYGSLHSPQISKACELPQPTVLADPIRLPDGVLPTGWLEVSPNRNMTPFVQARLTTELTGLPQELWQRLDTGWYYFRIRDDYGRISARWRCHKPG